MKSKVYDIITQIVRQPLELLLLFLLDSSNAVLVLPKTTSTNLGTYIFDKDKDVDEDNLIDDDDVNEDDEFVQKQLVTAAGNNSSFNSKGNEDACGDKCDDECCWSSLSS